jgi:hypothetical protein
MTILLFTDASTKNGASCWAYRSSLDDYVTTDICLTTNIAAMEILAIVKGLESLPLGSDVLVISDLLSAVNLITNRFQDPHHVPIKGNICHMVKQRLKALLKLYNVDAIWVASKCPNVRHLEVDQASKITLQEFLLGHNRC